MELPKPKYVFIVFSSETVELVAWGQTAANLVPDLGHISFF